MTPEAYAREEAAKYEILFPLTDAQRELFEATLRLAWQSGYGAGVDALGKRIKELHSSVSQLTPESRK